MMTKRSTLLISLALAGCDTGGDLPAYYQGGPAPAPSAISQHTENGNVGGDVVRIVGENFGGNPDGVTVVFGSQNATVMSVGNDEIVARVPQGPIQGGEVAVVVATAHGQGAVPGGYHYEVGDLLDDQAGYILVTNQWESCLGGIGKADAGVGCEQLAYTGHTGIEGSAAFLDVKFPNVHSMYVGWAGGSDLSFGEWKIQTPAQQPNTLDIENSYEDLKSQEVSGFRLVNTAWDEGDILEDHQWCSDLRHLESYRYSGKLGGDEYVPPFEISGAGNTVSETLGTSLLSDATSGDGTCLEADGRRSYDRRQLNFCETHEFDNNQPRDFESNWPVGESFFVGLSDDEEFAVLDNKEASEVIVDVPGLGLSQEVVLPPPISLTATAGFNDPGVGGDFTLWGLMELETCGDSNANGQFDLSDAAMGFTWEPFTGALTGEIDEDGRGTKVKGARTYVRFTVNVMDIGWFGGIGSSIRASIAVDDDHNFDPETGLSSMEIPAWVMYQFPSVDSEWGGESTVGLETKLNWADPFSTKYGYLIVTIDRVTEYTLKTTELDGDVVMAYVTGDFGFMGWDNPLTDPRDCNDCSDNDMDGWIDRDDPDCRDGDNETNLSFGQTTCNDGIDNDGDGLVDAKDTDCEDGEDSEGPECGDEIDNDGDGWTDNDDPDCTLGAGLFEDDSFLGTYTCNNRIDDDGDGWVDSTDPACEDASMEEDDGYNMDAQCNDGIDNDGNGDTDNEDTTCAIEGAGFELEAREMSDFCADGEDNDEDGYIDAKDPDCEFRPWNNEDRAFRGDGDPEIVSDEDLGIDQCYDNIDNDGDGATDSDDPGCWDADGTPNGFIDDESRALYVPEEDDDTGSASEDTGGESTDSGSAPAGSDDSGR
jgi:hypothetical protein